MKQNLPLSGRESSILALLVQSKSLSTTDKERILNQLEGKALNIAKVLVGQAENQNKDTIDAAKSFVDWAKSLSKRF